MGWGSGRYEPVFKLLVAGGRWSRGLTPSFDTIIDASIPTCVKRASASIRTEVSPGMNQLQTTTTRGPINGWSSAIPNSWMMLLARAVSGQAAISAKAHMTWHMTAPSSSPFGTCGRLHHSHCIRAVIRHVKQCCARDCRRSSPANAYDDPQPTTASLN